jgi:hypothetical protein
MKIMGNGWSRDMGPTVVADFNLTELKYNYDIKITWPSEPVIYQDGRQMVVGWFRQLRMMGNYRMKIEFSNDDILCLFKLRFGDQLKEWLVDDAGFTISPELAKRALQSLKLSDITLADLAAMQEGSGGEPATVGKLVEKSNEATFRRRV